MQNRLKKNSVTTHMTEKNVDTKKIVYLHIGQHKTGTTSIQKFLYKHRRRLRLYGYFVHISKDLTANLNCLETKMYDEIIQYNTLFEKEGEDGAKYYWHDLHEQLASTTLPYSILSAECLSFLGNTFFAPYRKEIIDIMQRTFAGYTVRVICYFRDSAALIPAIYNQHKKCDANKKTYLEAIRHSTYSTFRDPCQILDFYAEIFGKESLIIRKYDEESLVGGDSVSDFCHVIGCGKYFKPEKIHQNIRMSDDYLPLKCIFDAFQPQRHPYNVQILENILRCSEESVLSDEEFDILRENAQKLLDKYGVDVSKNLDDLKKPQFPMYSPEVNFQLIVSSLMFAEVQQSRSEVQQLREEIQQLRDAIQQLQRAD